MEIVFIDESIVSFIYELEEIATAKVLKTVQLLARFGPELRMPYSKPLGQGLFELRVRGKQEVRLIYTFHSNKAVILYAFVKKTEQILFKDLSIARARLIRLDPL